MDNTPINFNNLHAHNSSFDGDVEYAMVVEELLIERDYFKSELFSVKEGARVRNDELLRIIDCEKREKVFLEEEIYEGMREREELVRKIDESVSEKERISKEIEVLKVRNEELEKNLIRGLGVIASIKESLISAHVGFDEVLNFEGDLEDFVCRMVKKLCDRLSSDLNVLGSIEMSLIRVSEALDICEEEIEEEMKQFSSGLSFVLKMMKRVEDKLDELQKKAMTEKRELERSVLSLTEENRDVNTLLRIALVEKEAVEKSLNKLNEQKRVPLLQFAERGLQRVGFGFMMGGGTTNTEQSDQQKKDNEQVSENVASNASITSDFSSECEEEVVTLASTVEKMMKNLRLEIAQLKKALEESRLDAERLQCLTEKQAEKIAEQTVCIKDLKYQENLLSQNVEELLVKLNATEEDVERWTEACELEVKAGKHAVEERDKLVDILKRELDKTRASLSVSNTKLKLKEELANAAMAAQSASEISLQLADRRASGLNQRIDELTRQLEETEDREKKNKCKHRRVCWPWGALNGANPVRRVLPEMQALLHHRD